LASSTPGVKYFTHRTTDHADSRYINTCILHNPSDNYVVIGDNIISDDTKPDAVSGCADPSKTWPNCN
jgi:hypothetical protein